MKAFWEIIDQMLTFYQHNQDVINFFSYFTIIIEDI